MICDLVDWARTCGFPVVAAGRGHKWLPHFCESTPETVWGYYGLTPEQQRTIEDLVNREIISDAPVRHYETTKTEAEAAGAQARCQMHERDFGSIRCAVKHAFAKKSRTNFDTIKTANAHAIQKCFDRMHETEIIKIAVEFADALIDPCIVTIWCRSRASINYRIKIIIDANFKTI